MDELDRVSRAQRHAGLFHPARHLSLRKQARYGLGDQPVDKVFKLPPCDPADPNSVPDGATLYMKVPPKMGSMQVQLTYADGTTSPARSFNAPK